MRFGCKLLAILFVCVFGFEAFSQSAEIPLDGLVFYYPFSKCDANRAVDASGNGRHGALSGTEWYNKGHRCGTIEFCKEGDAIILEDDVFPDEISSLTFCAWIRCETRAKVAKEQELNHYHTDQSVFFAGEELCLMHLILFGPNRPNTTQQGRIEFGYSQSKDGSHNNKRRMWATSPEPVDDGEWHHIAATSDSSVLILYVDGEKVCERVSAEPYFPLDGEFRIGRYPLSEIHEFKSDRAFRGMMDEVALWNRVLSSEEIAVVMEATRHADPVMVDRSREMDQIAGFLLKGDFESVRKVLDGIEGESADDWKLFRRGVEEVLRMPEIIRNAYSSLAGKTVTVYLASGAQDLFISEVTPTEVKAEKQIVRGGQVVARVELNFRFDELTPQDKVLRLGKDMSPELDVMRGILASSAGFPEKAEKYFERSGSVLAASLKEHM